MPIAPPFSSSTERATFWLLVASLAIVQIKLLPAQVAFGLAAILWLLLAISDRRRPDVPAFFLPLALYAAWTLVSTIFSLDPVESLRDDKQLVLFLMVPIVMRLARGDRAMLTLDAIIAVGAVSALIGVIEAALLGYDNLDKRPRGMLSHWMTYSGILMLVTCAAAARLLFYSKKRIWPGVAVPALLTALALTLTVNAYVGTALAITLLVALRNWRLVIVLPIVALVAFAVSPAQVKSRVRSSLSNPTASDSNRDRIDMLLMGRDMIRDHPVFGVGPEMVGNVYGKYLRPNPVHTYNPHLHDVPVQIAAERGLPALALWLWFVVTAFVGLLRQFRRGPARALAGAGLAAIVAMLAAGLFEYNFGDSEFLMLFLGMITLPFAAARNGGPPEAARP